MLKPEISLPAALATGTLVWTIQGRHLGNQLDIRGNERVGDELVESARRQASWTAAAAVSGISLIARDPVIFIVGGAMVIALDMLTRYNNLVSPLTNRFDPSAGAQVAPAQQVTPSTDNVSYDLMSAVN